MLTFSKLASLSRSGTASPRASARTPTSPRGLWLTSREVSVSRDPSAKAFARSTAFAASMLQSFKWSRPKSRLRPSTFAIMAIAAVESAFSL
eukprot:3494283-Rhodomonas_salina.2